MVWCSLAIGLVCLGGLFWREARAAVEVWNASTAYSHCYLILPMALYLVWERRSEIRHRFASPEPIWALAAIPVGLVWLLAERLGFMEGRQIAAIGGVEILLVAVLGWRLFFDLSGPLLFLFFLVPFGAFITPALQSFTASFSTVGLDLLGIPNYSDKFTIETPAGTFFVAEACAGLRFLIAAVAFGVFYALLSYKNLMRRVAFIAACIVVPIIANGFRALGIVVLGQILGSAQAAAADHLVYGWIFFSIVMLLLIAGGQMFREHQDVAVVADRSWPRARQRSPVWSVAAVISILLIGPAFATLIDTSAVSPMLPDREALVIPGSCRLLSRAQLPAGSERRSMVLCAGTTFDVSVTLFSPRSTPSALVSERRRVTQEIGAEDAAIAPASVPDGAGRWTVVQTTDPNRVTAYASWIDGEPNQGGVAGRLSQARDSLLGATHAPALITITTAENPRSLPQQRKATLDELVSLLAAQPGLNARMAALSRVAP